MRRSLFLVSALAALVATPALPAQRAATARPAATARVDSIFARYRAANGPGCAVGVTRAGRELLARAYGGANLEDGVPLAPTSVLEAGSVSKQFTAAAIVLLAADGKLSLDDPVRRHVPELPAVADSVTLRHLLSHTSGLRDWGVLAGLAGWPRGTRVHTHAHVLDILSKQRALNFPAGTEYSYSNSGYNLLAVVAERASGRTLQQLTEERIFRPLGMTSTRWRDDFAATVPRRATAYAPAAGGTFRMDMPFENVYGNGGLLTTVGDLLKWSENFRPGSPTYGRVGGSRLVDLMQARAVLAGGDTITYALGLVASAFRGVPEVSHSGATAGYRAYLARYPRQELAVALLCNRADANPTALAHAVAETYLAGALSALPPAAAVAPERLAERAGLYRDPASGDVLRLVLKDGRLRAGFEGEGAELVPTGADRLRMGAGELQWTPAGNGRPARLTMRGARGRAVIYELVAPAPASAPATLAAYRGRYASPELGVTYAVDSTATGLALRLAPLAPLALEPLDADAFRIAGRGAAGIGGFVRFTRDAAGRVTGMELTTDRAFRVRFERE